MWHQCQQLRAIKSSHGGNPFHSFIKKWQVVFTVTFRSSSSRELRQEEHLLSPSASFTFILWLQCWCNTIISESLKPSTLWPSKLIDMRQEMNLALMKRAQAAGHSSYFHPHITRWLLLTGSWNQPAPTKLLVDPNRFEAEAADWRPVGVEAQILHRNRRQERIIRAWLLF